MGAALRLVKGAYNEPAEIAFPKERTSTRITSIWPSGFLARKRATRASARRWPRTIAN